MNFTISCFKTSDYVQEQGARRRKSHSSETFEKCSILFKFKEGENLSAGASLRVTIGIH